MKRIEIELPPAGTNGDDWILWFVKTCGRLLAHAPPDIQQFLGRHFAAASANNPAVTALGTAVLAAGVAEEVQAGQPAEAPTPPDWVDQMVSEQKGE